MAVGIKSLRATSAGPFRLLTLILLIAPASTAGTLCNRSGEWR